MTTRVTERSSTSVQLRGSDELVTCTGVRLSWCVPGVSLPRQHPQGMGPAPGGAGGRGGVCSPSPGAQGFPLLSPTSEQQGTKASLLEIPGSLQRCARQSWAKEREQNKAAPNVPQRMLLAQRGELLCCRPEKEHARIDNLSSPIKSVGISFEVT